MVKLVVVSVLEMDPGSCGSVGPDQNMDTGTMVQEEVQAVSCQMESRVKHEENEEVLS